ncbi:hypothetical protein V9L05_13100 [Bernardetia sp. Wsw4-3y2]
MNQKLKIKEFKNETGEVFLELGYDPEQNWGLTNWIGWVNEDNIKQGGVAMIELVKKYKIKNWLNDSRNNEGSWDGANDWIANSWMPQVVVAGLKKYSVILPKDLYSQLSAEFMADNAEQTGLQVVNWDSEEKAKA